MQSVFQLEGIYIKCTFSQCQNTGRPLSKSKNVTEKQFRTPRANGKTCMKIENYVRNALSNRWSFPGGWA